MENSTEFSINAGRKMLKNQTDKRVSEDAAIELNQDMEQRGTEVGEVAQQYAAEDGRVTVRAVDIRKAIQDVRGGGSQ